MSIEPTVPLTDEGHGLAKALVADGRFPSVSAVVEHGLTLVAREEEERGSRLATIRADLERRAAQPSVATEEIDRRLAEWRARRDIAGSTGLA